jgi:hypothetical protein
MPRWTRAVPVPLALFSGVLDTVKPSLRGNRGYVATRTTDPHRTDPTGPDQRVSVACVVRLTRSTQTCPGANDSFLPFGVVHVVPDFALERDHRAE